MAYYVKIDTTSQYYWRLLNPSESSVKAPPNNYWYNWQSSGVLVCDPERALVWLLSTKKRAERSRVRGFPFFGCSFSVCAAVEFQIIEFVKE